MSVRTYAQVCPEMVKNPRQFRAPDAHLVAEFPVATARTLGQKKPPSLWRCRPPRQHSASSPRRAFARWKRSWAPHLLGSGWLNRSDRNKRLREGGELDFQPTWKRSSTFLLMKGNALIPDVSLCNWPPMAALYSCTLSTVIYVLMWEQSLRLMV